MRPTCSPREARAGPRAFHEAARSDPPHPPRHPALILILWPQDCRARKSLTPTSRTQCHPILRPGGGGGSLILCCSGAVVAKSFFSVRVGGGGGGDSLLERTTHTFWYKKTRNKGDSARARFLWGRNASKSDAARISQVGRRFTF